MSRRWPSVHRPGSTRHEDLRRHAGRSPPAKSTTTIKCRSAARPAACQRHHDQRHRRDPEPAFPRPVTATLHEHSPPPPAPDPTSTSARARKAYQLLADTMTTRGAPASERTRSSLEPCCRLPKRCHRASARATYANARDLHKFCPPRLRLRYSSDVQYLLLASCRALRTFRPRSRPRPTTAQARWRPPRSERRRLRRRNASATRRDGHEPTAPPRNAQAARTAVRAASPRRGEHCLQSIRPPRSGVRERCSRSASATKRSGS